MSENIRLSLKWEWVLSVIFSGALLFFTINGLAPRVTALETKSVELNNKQIQQDRDMAYICSNITEIRADVKTLIRAVK